MEDEQILFVDLENVQQLDLAQLPTAVDVMVFYGITQKRLPVELLEQAQPLGARLKWIRISGQGKNALDFHIAFYVGQHLTRSQKATCVILSGDTGFDPLVRHLTSLGYSCRRSSSLTGAFPVQQASTSDSFARLISLLRKDKALPAKRKGLAGKVKSWFPTLSDKNRAAMLERLFSESYVQESGTSLAYSLES